MLNVFVISSDKRVASLIEHFQPFFKSKIRCASDFDNGLKEVFENRPSVVFIQSIIGSVSGETVSRHIKALLGSASPRIVFMGDSDNAGTKGKSWCDDWINVSDSDQQLQYDFSELIARCFPDDWREIRQEMEKSASSSGDGAQSRPGSENTVSSAAASEKERSGGGAADPIDAVNGKSVPSKKSASECEFLSIGNGNVDNDELPSYQNLDDDLVLLANASAPRRRIKGWFLFALLFLVVAGGASYFWTLLRGDRKVQSQSPAATARKNVDSNLPGSAERKANLKELPSFIHREWLDARYATQHPGWERYLSPEMEFRVFRESAMIKAIQGISRGPGGLDEAVLSQYLHQVGINDPLPSGKEASENNYLVKTFELRGGAELVTYRDQDGSQIKAFVLEFY